MGKWRNLKACNTNCPQTRNNRDVECQVVRDREVKILRSMGIYLTLVERLFYEEQTEERLTQDEINFEEHSDEDF